MSGIWLSSSYFLKWQDSAVVLYIATPILFMLLTLSHDTVSCLGAMSVSSDQAPFASTMRLVDIMEGRCIEIISSYKSPFPECRLERFYIICRGLAMLRRRYRVGE
jgi:hypothetical protein